jgi:hypothetical protein
MLASRLPWIVLAGVAGLLVVGFATDFAVNAGDSSGSPEGTATPPVTESTELPTTPPASTPTAVDTPAETPPPPTEPPPTTGPTKLPPPPPRPENPAVVEDPTLLGGQWYELDQCVVFYIPAGWTFVLHAGIGDPSGGFYTFEEPGSGSTISFAQDGLSSLGRREPDPLVIPVLDQIAATIESQC